MKRPHIAIYPWGFFALLVASLSLAQGNIPSMGITGAGKNESESVTISPENPTASWSPTLAPGFTAIYSVQIEESGDANGTNYTLK